MLDQPKSGSESCEAGHDPAIFLCENESSRSSDPKDVVMTASVRSCLQNQALEYNAQVTKQLYDITKDRYDLLEVCCPADSPLSQAVIDAGGRAYRMGLHNGYDLTTKDGLRKALTTLRNIRPRYVHVSPPCDPWSTMNNANQKTQAQVQNLERKQERGRLILRNCLKILQIQRQELDGQSGTGPDCLACHAGGEQPLRAASWKEPTVRRMLQLCNAERFRCDGCQFGMKSRITGLPIQKPYGWFSSLQSIRDALHRCCQLGNHEHAVIAGKEITETATYPKKLCKVFAKALLAHRDLELQKCLAVTEYENKDSEQSYHNGVPGYEPDPLQNEPGRGTSDEPWEPREAHDAQAPGTEEEEAPEEEPEEGESSDPSNWNPQQILRKLRTIHANLGHPSNQTMVRMLKEARAHENIVQAAMSFSCPYCARRGHAKPHRTSQVQQATRKWEIVSVDTFWWHSPHRDEKGNSREHVVGISWLDEASDFHVATIVRQGSQTQRVIKGEEFRTSFATKWLGLLPKPETLRFDDEGAFRDQALITWLEAQAIKISVIAGEAAWQMGKHSRHLEVLKENMSLLSLELGPDVGAEELLNLSLSAKNDLHSVQGYSPNQWCFGQSKERMQSYLQHGNHLPTTSMREGESFEASLQRAESARKTFLKADSRRRILRAARGQARKVEVFEVGELVYYYRRGRNSTVKHEAGWHGPARVVAVEKHGDSERNQTSGSVIWIAHATVLYRCAPEQLRKVPPEVKTTYETANGPRGPLVEIREAGNQANYRDISQDLQNEPEDSEVHDEGPTATRSRAFDAQPTRRHLVKRPPQYEPEGQPDRVLEGPGPTGRASQGGGRPATGTREVPVHEPVEAGPGEGVQRKVRREDRSRREQGPEVRPLVDQSPGGQHQVPEHSDVRPAEERHQSDREEFWRQADRLRHQLRGGVDGGDVEPRREQRRTTEGGHRPQDGHHGRDHQEHAGPDPAPRGNGSTTAADALPGPGADGSDARAAHRPERSTEHRGAPVVSGQEVGRNRSRSPFPRAGLILHNQRESYEPVLEKVAEMPEGLEGSDGCDVEEDVGSLIAIPDRPPQETCPIRTGCFAWQEDEDLCDGDCEESSQTYEGPEEGSQRQDSGMYFSQALEQKCEVFEIHMDIQPRDVHKVSVNGRQNWVLNEKPKKRAEVHFRTLEDTDKLEFLKAMRGELGSYLEHEAVAIARRHNVPTERILGMRWVLTWKAIENDTGDVIGRKPKARLIIKGYQDPDLLHLKRDSPTLATQNRNMILAIAAAQGWQGYVGDIKTAFLNGDQTEAQREIFAEPPEEVRRMLNMKPSEIFRILKAVYGLLHAPRAWSDKLRKELRNQGWVQSKLEPCVWRLYENGVLCGLIGVHVDDVLCCGSGSQFSRKVSTLKESFPFGSWKSLSESTTFCGCEIKQLPCSTIELSQERYGEGLVEIPLSRERKLESDADVTEAERKLFRAALGALSWRATQSAPWLSASVSYLQGCFKEAKVGDLLQVNKLIRTQRAYSQLVVRFPSNIVKPTLLTYHDASYACRRDGSSQGGVISMLVDHDVVHGKLCKFAPIGWQSRRLPRVCRSSTSAEIQAGSHAMDAHEFTKQIVLEWYNEHPINNRDMDSALAKIR